MLRKMVHLLNGLGDAPFFPVGSRASGPAGGRVAQPLGRSPVENYHESSLQDEDQSSPCYVYLSTPPTKSVATRFKSAGVDRFEICTFEISGVDRFQICRGVLGSTNLRNAQN